MRVVVRAPAVIALNVGQLYFDDIGDLGEYDRQGFSLNQMCVHLGRASEALD